MPACRVRNLYPTPLSLPAPMRGSLAGGLHGAYSSITAIEVWEDDKCGARLEFQ